MGYNNIFIYKYIYYKDIFLNLWVFKKGQNVIM